MKRPAGLALAALATVPGAAQEAGGAWTLACRFEGLPPVVRAGTRGSPEQRLRVGGRPEVAARDNGLAGSIATARLDGYTFRFFILYGQPGSPLPGVSVERAGGGVVVANRGGDCRAIDPAEAAAFLGPADPAPLRLPVAGGVP